MSIRTYVETFDEGSGGWYCFVDNLKGYKRLEQKDGAVISRSPWWIDYNHAPPGKGYMHMLFCLNTLGPETECAKEIGGANRFIAGGYPTDFSKAKMTIRVKGDFKSREAQLVLLLQGAVERLISPWALTSQPFEVSSEWPEQTVSLLADQEQWTCLGAGTTGRTTVAVPNKFLSGPFRVFVDGSEVPSTSKSGAVSFEHAHNGRSAVIISRQ